MNRIGVLSVVSSLLLVAAPLSAQTVIVNGNGTPFTTPLPNPGANDLACAGAADTWCAYDVRSNASVGQTTQYARNGNGSLAFASPSSPGKADFDIFFSAANQFRIKDLVSLNYDWYRNSGSTIATHLHPAIRLLVEGPNAYGTDALVYERAYNPNGPLPVVQTDTWVTENIGANTNLWWNKGGCGNPDFAVTLSDWADGHTACTQSILDNAKVIGFSVGVGSGWDGTFDGAVDNVSFQLAGRNLATTYNFEVGGQSVVPEPSTYALMFAGLGAVGFAARRRRQTRA